MRVAVRAGIVVLASILLVGGLYAWWAYSVADRSTGTMLIVGRRGDVANWPENTLEGLLAAARLGADGIEFDVRRSADGTFYVMHDPTVDRTTNGSGAIVDMHDAEIDALAIDGGLGFDGHKGLTVPRLQDVLNGLAEYRGLLLLDAKGDPGEHGELARMIAPLRRSARISCSTRADVVAVGGALPTYGSRGIGVDQAMDGSPLPWTAWFWPVEVSAINEKWTGDERDAMDRARRWGVELYLTNHLAAALATKGR